MRSLFVEAGAKSLGVALRALVCTLLVVCCLLCRIGKSALHSLYQILAPPKAIESGGMEGLEPGQQFWMAKRSISNNFRGGIDEARDEIETTVRW